MRIEILNKLQQSADEKYRIFTAKLLPPDVPFLGVRIPVLRGIAKQLIKEGRAVAYLEIPPEKLKYQDELILYALLLAQSKQPYPLKLKQIKAFVPFINSWAVCDIFCAALKDVKTVPENFYEAFLSYTQSKAEYQIRFFYVIALGYFITPAYLEAVFSAIRRQQYVGFYDKMAVAWLLSVAYVKYPRQTENFILTAPLDSFVFKKTISKICDSFRVSKEAKVRLRTLASQRK